MATTFDIYPSNTTPPIFSEVVMLAHRRLTEFGTKHGLGTIPPLTFTLHNQDEEVSEIGRDAPMIWPEDNYVWFQFGDILGGSDAYCRILDEEGLACWEEQIKVHEPARSIASHVRRCVNTRRWWYFRRSAGQPAIVNLGYGFLAAALAEITNGIIYSEDNAWEYDQLPCSAEKFYDLYFNPAQTQDSDRKEWIKRNLADLKNNGMGI
ncbi:MAG: hypothetical protein QM715_16480 [Nibricoccus sp.]